MTFLRRIADRIMEKALDLSEGTVEEHVLGVLHGATGEDRDLSEEVLLRRGGPAEARELLATLEEGLPDGGLERVARTIGRLAGPDLLPRLSGLATDEDPFVRYGAFKALRALLGRRTDEGEPLVEPAGEVRSQLLDGARDAFRRWGIEEPIGVAAGAVRVAVGDTVEVARTVRGAVQAEEPVVRQAGFILTGRLGVPGARAILLDGLAPDTDQEERHARRTGLWHLDHPTREEAERPDQVIALIADLGLADRSTVLEAQGMLSSRIQVTRPHLLEATDDPEPLVRSGCLAVLGWTGETSVRAELETFVASHLEDPDVPVDHALVALGRLGDPASYELLRDVARDHWGSDLGWRAAEALGLLGDERAAAFLRDRILDAGEGRDACLGILGRLGSTAPLEDLLDHPDPELRGRAAIFLLRANPSRADRVRALRDEETDPEARALLDRALQQG